MTGLDWLGVAVLLAPFLAAVLFFVIQFRGRPDDKFLTYLQSRVTELERQLDGMHQRGLVSPQAPAPPEPATLPLPHEVEVMIDGFEDPEVQALLRGQAADHFGRFPTADPAAYVADLLRDR